MKITRETIATIAVLALVRHFPRRQCTMRFLAVQAGMFLPMSPSVEAPALEASAKEVQASTESDAPNKPEASIVGSGM